MIFPIALAISDYVNTKQYMIYVNNKADNNFYRFQNNDSSLSSTLQAASAFSPLLNKLEDSPLIFYGNDSSIISEAIGNSPELIELEKESEGLDGLEKIEKLKKQWLELLP
ncbi:MAG TPA: hypothetical protein VFV86_08040 [Nitrososphaeraceae archaeon]|nr:hypothetical protein [Nitrososphaeraceae archaeon]